MAPSRVSSARVSPTEEELLKEERAKKKRFNRKRFFRRCPPRFLILVGTVLGVSFATAVIVLMALFIEIPKEKKAFKCKGFMCDIGRCIPSSQLCDGISHCSSDVIAEDERNCGTDIDGDSGGNDVTGYDIIELVGYCSSNPCQNNGRCVLFEDHYECNCRQGFSGTQCQHRCDKYHGDSCYSEVQALMTWQEASDYCATGGGHLIDIRSQEEEAAILLDRDVMYHFRISANQRCRNPQREHISGLDLKDCLEYCYGFRESCFAVEYDTELRRCMPQTADTCTSERELEVGEPILLYLLDDTEEMFLCNRHLLTDPSVQVTLSASSSLHDDSGPDRSLLDTLSAGETYTGAWVARHNDDDQWIRATFEHVILIEGVVTQGRQDAPEWVDGYTIQYHDGINMRVLSEQFNTFNSDQNTKVVNLFAQAIATYRLELHITSHVTRVSLRWELIGCGSLRGKPAYQTSVWYDHDATQAIDGTYHSDFFNDDCSHTGTEFGAWWAIDLGVVREVHAVHIFNRHDCCSDRLAHIYIWLTTDTYDPRDATTKRLCTYHQNQIVNYHGNHHNRGERVNCDEPTAGRYLIIQHKSSEMQMQALALCEVLIYDTFVSCADSNGLELFSESGGNLVVSASSFLSYEYRPDQAFLQSLLSSWRPAEEDSDPFIQADLLRVMTMHKVATQGSIDAFHWVSTFKIRWSLDGWTTQEFHDQDSGIERVFVGNEAPPNTHKVVANVFPEPITARYVWLIPQGSAHTIGLRWELYGCDYGRWTDGKRVNADQWGWSTSGDIYMDTSEPEADGDTYINWTPLATISGTDETVTNDCMQVLQKADTVSWIDHNCSALAYAVCEYPVVGINECIASPCENGGTCHDDPAGGFTCNCRAGFTGDICEEMCLVDACYYSFSEQTTRPQAQAHCNSLDANLVVITDDIENTIVQALVQNIGTEVWTDGVFQDQQYKWQSKFLDMSYSNWMPGEPDDDSNTCIAVTTEGLWKDEQNCNLEKSYICEKDIEQWHGWGIYEFLLNKYENWTYTEAAQACVSQYGDNSVSGLVVVNNHIDIAFMRHLMEQQGDGRYWIGAEQGPVCSCDEGATDSVCELCRSAWVWRDGTPMEFWDWLPQQPGSGECGSASKEGWADDICTTKKRYICRRCKTHKDCYTLNTDISEEATDIANSVDRDLTATTDDDMATCAFTAMVRKPWWYVSLPRDTVPRHVTITGTLPTSEVNPVSFALMDQDQVTDVHTATPRITGYLETSWCRVRDIALVSGSEHYIANEYLTASTVYQDVFRPSVARMNSGSAWCPHWRDINDPYIQVDLRQEYYVTRIQTGGLPNTGKWTETLEVGYSFNGQDWERIKSHGTNDTIRFAANQNLNDISEIILLEAVHARFIRLYPTTWTWEGTCLRFELFGCTSMTYSVVFPATPVNNANLALLVYENDDNSHSQLQICDVQVLSHYSDDIDICELNNPCENEATCVDTEFGFHCACEDGYRGDFCQLSLDECLSEPCQHGGTCTDGLYSYTCACPCGYFGHSCEYICTNMLDDFCYWVLSFQYNTLAIATEECATDGGSLVDITSMRENEFIFAMAAERDVVEMWTSGYYDHASRTWRWRSTGEAFTYRYGIFPDDPNIRLRRYDYVAVSISDSGYTWEMLPSFLEIQAMCKYRYNDQCGAE